MQRYFIHFSYDGAAYHGFQTQPNGISVQTVVEDALRRLLHQPTTIVAAGRTDAGVHARHMVAHFDTPAPIDASYLTFRLNCLLPKDIAVQGVVAVPSTLHARFSAVRRTYKYYIHTAKDPFLDTYSLETHYTLDFERMNAAALLLVGRHDFAAFAKSHSDVKTTLCTVLTARWEALEADCYPQRKPTRWCFTITADRFLRNMVRAIVGTLIDVGRGKMSVDDVKALLAGGVRNAAGDSMPAHALFLYDVEY